MVVSGRTQMRRECITTVWAHWISGKRLRICGSWGGLRLAPAEPCRQGRRFLRKQKLESGQREDVRSVWLGTESGSLHHCKGR